MGSTVCTLSEAGRHSVSMGVINLNLLLVCAGDILVMVALYLKFVLEAQVAVVIGNHAGALAYFLLAVGLVLCFVCAAAAKTNYDGGSQEMATTRTCKMLLFILACQGLTVLLLFAAIIMCLVHKALIRDVLHNGFIAAIKLYRVNEHTKTGINRIQARFQCCGSRTMQDWFKIPWIPMNFVNVDHPDVARHIVDGDFITDNAPYSCCDVHISRPCVHHQVQNISAHRMLGPMGTLYTTACNDRLEAFWKSNVLNPVLGLLLLITLFMVLAMVLSRLLQTSLEDALDKGDPREDGDAYCIRSCPCIPLPSHTHTVVRHDQQSQEAGKGDGGDRDDGEQWRKGDTSYNKSFNSYCISGGGPVAAGEGRGVPHINGARPGGRGDAQEYKTNARDKHTDRNKDYLPNREQKQNEVKGHRREDRNRKQNEKDWNRKQNEKDRKLKQDKKTNQVKFKVKNEKG